LLVVTGITAALNANIPANRINSLRMVAVPHKTGDRSGKQ
jgi:hypothetical protein